MARTARKIDEEDAFGPNAPVESVRLQLEAMIGERNSDTASSTVVWRQTVHEYYSVRESTKRIYLRGPYRLERYEEMSYTVSCDTTQQHGRNLTMDDNIDTDTNDDRPAEIHDPKADLWDDTTGGDN